MPRSPLVLIFCSLLGCHPTPPPKQKLPPSAQFDAFGRPRLGYLDPSATPPLVINPTVDIPADADWQVLDSAVGRLTLDSATLNFAPRSAQWRFTLTSESTPEATAKPNEDHSYIKVNLWIADKDAAGKVGLRPVKVNFKRKGGASCIQDFDNGLWPDGSPRPFQITITGTYVTFQAKVEDLGATRPATQPPSPER